MSFNLGINVVEVNGATPSIQGAPTSVACFVIRAQRGVPGVVRQISNFTQFTDYFGGYVKTGTSDTQTSFVGAYAIRGFFDNGGSLAYVMRIADATVAKAGGATFPAAAAPPAPAPPAPAPPAPPAPAPPAPPAPAPPAPAGGAGAGDTAAPALTVTAGFRGTADPGNWSHSIGIAIVSNTSNPKVTDAFDLVVAQSISAGGVTTYKILETWPKLSMSGAPGYQLPSVINDPATGSKYITVAASGTAAPAATASGSYTLLDKGADDTLSGDALNTALAAPFSSPSPLDTLPIQLLACPESADATVVKAALTYCANRGDCMFVGHVPDGGAQPLAAAKTYGQSLQSDKVYGALYLPYIQVVDPVGTLVWIPPTGHVMGVYARTDQQRGIWKAPAGNAALINNALAIRASLNDTDHTDLVKNGSVNAIRSIAGAGIIIDSSRTLSTNTLWLYVNVRLLFNFVKSSLKSGLRWVVQEPNDSTLWNKIKYNSVTPFLMGLWRAGAFGPGAAKDVFTVKVDAENNPPSNIQQGILNVEVYFYPSRPAETIVITVGQQEAGATATER
jgi:phage tail sheath protein FI